MNFKVISVKLLKLISSSQFASVSPNGAPGSGVGGLDAGPDGGDGREGPEVGACHHSVESLVLKIMEYRDALGGGP